MCSNVCECVRRKNKITSPWNHKNHEQTEGSVISKRTCPLNNKEYDMWKNLVTPKQKLYM